MSGVVDYVAQNNPQIPQHFHTVEYPHVVCAFLRFKYLSRVRDERETEKILHRVARRLRLRRYRFFLVGLAFLFYLVLQFCSKFNRTLHRLKKKKKKKGRKGLK